jgi:hypothetical protein
LLPFFFICIFVGTLGKDNRDLVVNELTASVPLKSDLHAGYGLVENLHSSLPSHLVTIESNKYIAKSFYVALVVGSILGLQTFRDCFIFCFVVGV